MSLNDKKHFCVIGAGVSGLVAIKSCLEHGLNVTCFEKRNHCGGLWQYDNQKDTPTVPKTSVIHSSKEALAFSDFPPPPDFPVFMRHERVAEYLNLYCDKFGLKKYIEFSTKVVGLEYADDYDNTGCWKVTVKKENCPENETRVFDAVFVCSNCNSAPNFPEFDGLDSFQGVKVHSQEYKKGDSYEDKNILVIGIGNFSASVSVELCKTAKSVHISTRSGAWCFPQTTTCGKPLDGQLNRYTSFWLNILPRFLANILMQNMFVCIDHDLLGIRPRAGPVGGHLVLDDEFPCRIMNGLIKVKPNIVRFGPNWASFADGSKIEDLDVVIFATGFRFCYPYIPDSIVSSDENIFDLYKMVFPYSIQHQTLAFLGCIQPSLGSLFTTVEMQARWAVLVFNGDRVLPSRKVQWKEIKSRQHLMALESKKNHTVHVDYIKYLDDIASEIGCKPSFLRMLFTFDFRLASRCIFGQFSSYQYRLRGPCPWDGAREAILGLDERMLFPLNKHKFSKYRPSMVPVASIELGNKARSSTSSLISRALAVLTDIKDYFFCL